VASITPRTVLVLGGGSDIGAACVAALAGHGVRHVVLAARSPHDAVTALRSALSAADPAPAGAPEILGLAWDALDVDGAESLLDEIHEAVGVPDVVIVAVGLLGHHAGLGLTPAQVDKMVRTNFAGPAAALAAVAERLADSPGGPRSLVVLSSVAGVRPRRSNFAYGSSKAGLDAFALGLSDALADTSVRVLVVRPGFVRSSMTVGLDPAPFATNPETVGRHVGRAVLSGRSGVISVPPILGPLFSILRSLPVPLWRRIAGNR